MENNFEKKYKKLLLNILGNSNIKNARNGNTFSVFGKQLNHDLADGFPILTSKKMYSKNFIGELIWFLNGETNIKYLKDNGVSIWDKWADKNGDLGPVYGYQMRKFNGKVDQLFEIIQNIKKNPYSRRHVITLWNPSELEAMRLPPCYFSFQFYCDNRDKLCLNVFMRSCDAFVGLPYDFALHACLLMVVAKETGLIPGIINFNFTDLHIYQDHLSGIIEYINNKEYALPKMTYIGNLVNIKMSDFTLLNYKSEKFIKVNVAM